MEQTAKKQDRLHIRTLPRQKELLARAAKARHLNVSQFVLQTSLEAAEKVIREEEVEVIKLNTADFDILMRKLEEPPQDKPTLRRLLTESPVWNG